MIDNISKEEALNVLTSGLERFEQNNPYNLPDDVLDKCYDVEMYLKLEKPVRPLGRCYYRKRKIEIYKHTRGARIHDIVDTILHELAHHISYQVHGRKGTGHGHYWQDICRMIGAKPSSTSAGIAEKAFHA